MKSQSVPVLDRILDPVSRCLTPDVARAIAAYKVDDETQKLLDSFAAKNTAGRLTVAERAAYETYVSALDFVAILQSKARQIMKRG